MRRTPIHRALGETAGELTSAMLNEAVKKRLVEGQELDWKTRFPEGLSSSDFPKDVAAMANSGGGLIVYGVGESDAAATRREDVEFSEGLERQIRAVAAAAISPPVLGLEIQPIGDDPPRAVAVRIQASEDAPHLIMKQDRFGAPVRNGADTRWMSERELERAYRARFEERRRAGEALEDIYAEVADAVDSQGVAWLVAVARPGRTAGAGGRVTADDARSWAESASLKYRTGRYFVMNGLPHNYLEEIVGSVRARPGLRSQILQVDNANGLGVRVSVHDAGAVTFAARLGKQCTAKSFNGEVWTDPEDVFSSQLEAAAASRAALVEAQGLAQGWPETVVDVRVGIAWTGPARLRCYPGRPGNKSEGDDSGLTISQYRPVSASWVLDDSGTVARDLVVDLALDLVNQAGQRDVTCLQR